MDLTPSSPATGAQSREGIRSVEPLKPATSVFFGAHGLRVAWRLPIALGLWFIIVSISQTLLLLIPGMRAWLHAQSASGIATPGLMFFSEGTDLAGALGAMLVMTKIEGRSFSGYYLPWGEAFGRRFWQGLPFGFLMISLLMGVIALGHGYSFGQLGAGSAARL